MIASIQVSKKTLWKFNSLSCIINVAKQLNFHIRRKQFLHTRTVISLFNDTLFRFFSFMNFNFRVLFLEYINNLLPSPIFCLFEFEFNYNIHDYFTRHRQELHITSQKYSFSIRAQRPKNWNSILLLIRQLLATQNFRSILKNYYI